MLHKQQTRSPSIKGNRVSNGYNVFRSENGKVKQLPRIEIVPIVLDVREGGQVELLCDAGKS